MRTLVLSVAAVAVAFWSLFAWGVYALLGFAGEIAAGSTVLFPFLPPELVFWAAQLLGGMGGVAVWIVWGLGVGIIAMLTLMGLALFGRRRAEPRRAYEQRFAPQTDIPPPAQRGQIGPNHGDSVQDIVTRLSGRNAPR